MPTRALPHHPAAVIAAVVILLAILLAPTAAGAQDARATSPEGSTDAECRAGRAAPCSYWVGRGALRLARVEAASAGDPAASGSWRGDLEHYGNGGANQATVEVSIGGGGAGFDGAVGGSYDLGYRHPLSDGHALLARVGGAAHLQDNDLLHFSMLEAPRITAAWQYLRAGLLVEAGTRGGAVLAGGYRAGEGGRRPLRSLDWGGFVSARGLDYFHVDVDVMRIEPTSADPHARLTRGRASMCIGRRAAHELFGFGLCLDGTLFRAAPGPDAAGQVGERTSSFLGVSSLGPLVTGRSPESDR